ncbi:hypothetical protein Acsp06_30590 [Actinomycetospora sp. NBRC 106375]|uniref:hypothetical protein n=1 Tax=Actinomycetospora sp. NBRC 106375 TaxID=3032207 RepID=UPI0024A5E6C7|nr:hypothetical protein [Actinomycetospora sp. NBRC 106375]GLZ46874.1 hypothetical protein Acsp06_30590 [Actinomycetospora sp. NBRC 106375]
MTEGTGGTPGSDGESLSGGHYRLGAARSGLVRSARDTWDDRDVVAVALAPDGGSPDPGALTRVARDVRRGGEHPHPGLAPVLDVAAGADRRLWLVHEVPAGARGLAALDPVPADRLLGYALVLAGALRAAHAARLVHGRIGADVVLVGAAGSDGSDGAGIRLLGAPSGTRPDDRPGAEDDDARALAATLAAVPVVDADDDTAERLAAVLTRAAQARPETAGGLATALQEDLHALEGSPPDGAATPAEPAGRPTDTGDGEPAIRRTEVISTAAVTGAWSPTRPEPFGAPPTDARPTTRVGVLASPSAGPAPAAPAPRSPAGGPPAGPASAPPRAPLSPRPPHPPGPPHPPHPPGPSTPPPARSRRGLVVVAVVAVLVLLAGVVAAALSFRGGGTDDTGGTGGAAGAGDRVVPAVIGDARTVEPCAVTDPAAISGTARVVPDLGSPAACTVLAAVPGGDVVVVATLEPVATAVTEGREERVGSLVVRRSAPRDGICSRTVVTTEGVQVAVDAAPASGSSADPCASADAATDATVRTLLAGAPLPRRATADPPAALTTVDACALLDPDDLEAVPGLDAARVAPGVGGWSCRWGSEPGAGGTVAEVAVERRRTFTATADVGGRPATVTDRRDSCDVAVAQRAYTAVDGSPRVELLEVSVHGPPEDRCAAATGLAAAAVPRLPAP